MPEEDHIENPKEGYIENYEDDYQLLEAVKNSDTAAFKALCHEYYQAIFGFFFRRTQDLDTTVTLLGLLFRNIWLKRNELVINSSLKTFIYRRANELVLTYMSQNPHKQPPLEENLSEGRLAFSEQVYHELHGLPEAHRFAFMLKRYERLSYSEIADIMSNSVETVEGYLVNSVKYLRDRLKHFLVKAPR